MLRGGIILIDEIENGLHYCVIADVWKVLADAARRLNVQIFATTHSGEMIHAAHEAFKESTHYDFRYHRLDRHKDGANTATPYNEEPMETSFELDLEVQ